MPFWAIVYCLIILLSGIIVIFIRKQRPVYYIAGQILSSLLSVLIFVFYFESFFTRPQSLVIIIMVTYIFYWELWENRYLLPKIQSQGEISPDTEQYNAQFQVTLTKKIFIVFWIGTIAIFLPFLYVAIRLIVSYL